MKQNGATKLVMFAACLGVIIYFGFQIYRYFVDPITTVVAYRYQAETTAAVTGWVVREEQVLEGSADGLLRILRAEGERVSAGGEVAVVYADEASLERQEQIESLNERIEQYEYAQVVEQGNEALIQLDQQILTHLRSLQSSLSADKLDDSFDTCVQELRSLSLKRDYTYTGATEDLESTLSELRVQLESLQAQSAASVRQITAPVSGLYSAVADGYETVLTPSGLESLTPSVLSNIQPVETVSQLGKLILGDYWYYAAVVEEAELERLEVGTAVQLRFAKGVDQDLSANVQSVSAVENGYAVVVFRGNTYLSELTLLRQQNADIIYSTTTGFRVPLSALHVENVSETLDDGTVHERQTTVVYCLVSQTVRFKPVTVSYNGDGYALVEGTSDTERRRLREGDEIIINGRNIADGMTVS